MTTTEKKAAKNSKASKTAAKDVAVEIRSYAVDAELSIPRRIADCLYWCAQVCPRQAVPLHLLATAVYGFKRVCSPQAAEIAQLKKRLTYARGIMLRDYACSLISSRGIGVRASVDSDEVTELDLKGKIRRYKNARTSADAVLSIINTDEMKNPVLRNYVNTMRPAFKALSNPTLIDKLLPPTPPDSPTTKKK